MGSVERRNTFDMDMDTILPDFPAEAFANTIGDDLFSSYLDQLGARSSMDLTGVCHCLLRAFSKQRLAKRAPRSAS